MREKLIELLDEVTEKLKELCGGLNDHQGNGVRADHLIANGVTVHTPNGCDYCVEDSEGCRRANGAFWIAHPFHAGEWFLSTGHCKPRQIYFCPMCGRELPKGE